MTQSKCVQVIKEAHVKIQVYANQYWRTDACLEHDFAGSVADFMA